MQLTTGRYAESDRPATLRSRLYWLRTHLVTLWLSHRRATGDTGLGHTFRREWGGWAVRPCRGWRRLRWVTPPTLYTRRYSAADEDGAIDWALGRMGLPH